MHNGRYTNTYVKQAIKKLRLLDDYLESNDDGSWGTPVRRVLAFNLTGELIVLLCDLEEILSEQRIKAVTVLTDSSSEPRD